MKPIGNNVLIRPIAAAEKSMGGILLPEASRENPQEGVVVALGTGAITESGQKIPFDVKVGDKVLLSKYGAIEVEWKNEKLKLANAEDILAIIG